VVDDEPLTRAELDDVLAAAVGRERLRPMPNLPVRLLGDKLDHVVRSHRISNRAFRQATGWAPRYASLRDGLSDGPAVDVGVALDEAETGVEAVRRLP
jgi:hypothetical protein